MNKASKRKVEMILPMDEAAAFLKKLGEDMETGVLRVGNSQIELEGFKSIGLSIKEEGEDLRVKLKVKYPKQELPYAVSDTEGALADAASADDDADLTADDDDLDEDDDEILVVEPEEEFASLSTRPRPKYKSLKKRMKTEFKAIKMALQQGTLPERALVHAFARDSELMITYPGKGDEYYKDYESALQQFLVAVSEADLEAVSKSVAALDHCKKVCHDKYD